MRRPRPGYSLLEMMIVVAVLGVLVTVGATLMIQMQNFVLMTTARNDIERDARACLDTINRFLRQAYSGTICIDTPAGQGPNSRITFTHVNGSSFSYYQKGPQLIQRVNPHPSAGTPPCPPTDTAGDSSVISRNLTFIAFTFPRTEDPTIVSVAMTMGKSVQLGQQKYLELTIQKVRVMN